MRPGEQGRLGIERQPRTGSMSCMARVPERPISHADSHDTGRWFLGTAPVSIQDVSPMRLSRDRSLPPIPQVPQVEQGEVGAP